MCTTGCSGRGGSIRRGCETVGGLRCDTSSFSGAPRSLRFHRGINEGYRPETDDNTGEFTENSIAKLEEHDYVSGGYDSQRNYWKLHLP